MKNLSTAGCILLFSLLYLSCTKNESHYLFAQPSESEKLEADIYPVATRPTELVIGNEQSVCSVGETLSFFLPYQVSGDDVQNAQFTMTDALTGETVRELPMSFFHDLSVLNVTVPEEIQGRSFMFVNVPIENDLIGRTLNISTKIIASKQTDEDKLMHAVQVQ